MKVVLNLNGIAGCSENWSKQSLIIFGVDGGWMVWLL
jgi:hypothetical protein